MEKYNIGNTFERSLIVTGLLAVIGAFTTGCSNLKPSLGNYPLGEDKAISEAVAKYRSERQKLEAEKNGKTYGNKNIPLISIRIN